MERRFIDLVSGYVRIRITGTSYDRFLNLCAFHRIRLWNLLPEGEGYGANISRRDFKKLKTIVRKSHVRLQITRRSGLSFFLHRYRKRKVYGAGILAAFFFMLWLSSHVWNITIDGNLSQTDDIIFEYLDTEGICHGMRKAEIDCKELAARIRNYFTGFSWVAVELKGTWLQIHVREGLLGEETAEDKEETPSDLVASEDGTVVSIYVRQGLPQVEAGTSVKKGDLLVTGALPVYNDSGEVASWQYTASDADIVIRNEMEYREEMPRQVRQKRYTGMVKKDYLVEVGSIPLSLPVSFDPPKQYDLTVEVRQLKLMENFYLPLYFKIFTAKEYQYQEITYTTEEITEILSTNLQYFIQNLEEKGVQIFQNDVKIEWTETTAVAAGKLIVGKQAAVTVPITEKQEEIPENEHS